MKPQHFLFSLLLLLAVASCVRDPEPIGGDPIGSAPTTSLEFYTTQSNTALEGVFVGINSDQNELDNGTYLLTRTTGGNGRAIFKDLDTLTYWYIARYDFNGQVKTRTGNYTLTKDQQAVVQLYF
jgi:hypothetical protein